MPAYFRPAPASAPASSIASPQPIPPAELLVGETRIMRDIFAKVHRLAATNVPVLLQGESGTGKEVWARLLHLLSGRPGSAFVKVHCPAIPSQLFESEMFGYERGAFTGAKTAKAGRVEQAHGGSLLLDEVGSLELAVQSKLLQFLDDGTFVRVGGHEPQKIEARLISTANGDLRAQVAAGAFRLDLLYRINAVTIDLPPLRSRIEDVPALVQYFITLYAAAFQQPSRTPSRAILRQMQEYRWPGNIRQLENAIRAYVLIGSEDVLTGAMSVSAPAPSELPGFDLDAPISLKELTRKATRLLERQIILKVLEANLGNRQKTAKRLNISYRSLLYKLTESELSGTDGEDGTQAIESGDFPEAENAEPTSGGRFIV
jgi:two-component system response regulator AtoC